VADTRGGVGFRAAWLNHAGLISRHSEVVLHAFDRELKERPLRVLHAGCENGGTLQVLSAVLPAGSSVLGLERLPSSVPLEIPVLNGDVLDRAWVSGALRSQWFDLIIDSTNSRTPWLWPYLIPGGRYLVEGCDPVDASLLASGVYRDTESWLPVEEIMRVTVFPGLLVIEKRNPRVLPYVEVMVGNFSDVVPEDQLIDRGVRRVIT